MIGSSLEAKVLVEAPDEYIDAVSKTDQPEDFFIVSRLETKATGPTPEESDTGAGLPGVKITVSRVEGEKCPRCWKWSTGIGESKEYPDICPRCAGVMSGTGN